MNMNNQNASEPASVAVSPPGMRWAQGLSADRYERLIKTLKERSRRSADLEQTFRVIMALELQVFPEHLRQEFLNDVQGPGTSTFMEALLRYKHPRD
ncbi:hypothetical protein [Aestuariivirga litoralis]|uniref:hypothetical protein n=1 Tax=Aestuariivirga litoralis TaxID=2650924 RepID=UPI0018C7FEE6|nr:hypothetical protein [Aestuariivirga litoralis]MBG1231080.1 hypothetical protein [Aestuariivirga litoralis]